MAQQANQTAIQPVSPAATHERALIIDFGSQVTQLIARRVRENGVYCEIHPFNKVDGAFLGEYGPKAIIFSGGPSSVTDEDSPRATEEAFKLGVPILAICYGQQTMAVQLGGVVEGGHAAEFGRADVEIKKASPSAGLILADFDPARIARVYHAAGAAALSVLTDRTYFQGRLEYVEEVKQSVPLPVLRKEFIIDEYQVYESRAAGADAVLLIAEVLKEEKVVELTRSARHLGMTPLVEAHTEANLRSLLCVLGTPGPDSYLLGINNRDLRTFTTRLELTLELLQSIPRDRLVVSESGIATHADLARLGTAGARAVLVGESLLRAPEIGRALDTLRGLQ